MNLSGLDEINADIGRFNYLYVGNQQFYAYTGAGPSGMGPTGPQGPIGTKRPLTASWASVKRYRRVYLGLIDGKQCRQYVHRLVAQHFIPNPNNCKYIDHISGNPLDNRVENLRWCDQSENRVNTSVITNNKTGQRGISEKDGKYTVHIYKHRRRYFGGTYFDIDRAILARNNNNIGKKIVWRFF